MIDFRRIRYSESALSDILFLVFYSPFGIILALTRIICLIFLQIILIFLKIKEFRRKFIKDFALYFLGLKFEITGYEMLNSNEFIVSNHMSNIDQLCLSLIFNEKIEFFCDKMTPLAMYICELLKYKDINIKTIKIYFPEMKISGCKGVNDFIMDETNFPMSSFSLIGLKYYRPYFPVEVSFENSQFWQDILICLFCPSTTIYLKYIPYKPEQGINVKLNYEIMKKKICEEMRLDSIVKENKSFVKIDKMLPKSPPSFNSINKTGDSIYRERKLNLYREAKKRYENTL